MTSHQTILKPMLRKLRLRSPLERADELAILSLPYRVKPVAAHDYLVRERQKTSECYVMLSGFSIRHKIVRSGARQIVAMHMKGDLVDLQNALLATADHSVQMLGSGEVAVIPRAAIGKLTRENPAVAMALWQDTLVDGSIFREWIANVGRRDATARLAHVLCEFSLRFELAGLGERTKFNLPMTQDQLADITGLTAVHVNRTLMGLERRNLIRRTQRSVTVGDWDRLADAGDFDGTYLHLEPSMEAAA